MNDILYGIFSWIRDDFKSNPFRFTVELVAWAISIGCSITMAVTVPNPPLLVLYTIGQGDYYGQSIWCTRTSKN
jgi:hypothetical protein